MAAAEAARSFFEQQHLARRNTRVMVILFFLAVVAIVLAVDLVIAGVWLYLDGGAQSPAVHLTLQQRMAMVPRSLMVWGGLATATIVFIVSMVNVSQLASGGAAVAEMVGARRVATDTKDAAERRLVNVVEEMAIASGVRVPAVYVMDGEAGINAFAAGWDVSGSVVAVTRGTLETLTRDELQGVVGHEFSHILNGDMRLNIRMMGVLAGIVFLGAIGEFLMRSTRDSDSKYALPVLATGLALFLIGYVGLFFARLIKAAVSRQREFLADASSVQFTRNPDGIAGALDQIRLSSAGALIAHRRGEDMSHMLFGQGIRVYFGGLFDTHPPVEERIVRANPRFHASEYRRVRDAAVRAQAAQAAAAAPAAGRRAGDLGTAWGRSAAQSTQLVGAMQAGKIDYAATLIASLPAGLEKLVREPDAARAVMVALLLAPKAEVMAEQLAAMQAAGAGALGEKARAIAPLASQLGPAYHLPVVDLGLSAVKQAPEEAKQELLRGLEAVINADRRVSLHEFVVLTLVRDQLTPKAKPGRMPSKKLDDLGREALLLLAIVAHAGTRADATGDRKGQLQQAYAAGAKVLGQAEAVPAAELTLGAAASALQALKELAPMQKGVLINALFATVTADGTVRVIEAELMRLVGAVLDCPLPPLLDELSSFS